MKTWISLLLDMLNRQPIAQTSFSTAADISTGRFQSLVQKIKKQKHVNKISNGRNESGYAIIF